MKKTLPLFKAIKTSRIFFFTLFFICGSFLCFAAEGVSVNIRYYDKKIYFAEGDPIFVELSVINTSPEVYRFRLAAERAFSVDFLSRTLAGRSIELPDSLERRRATSGRVFFRDVSIEPGESFAFVENLRDFSNITGSGSFVVQAYLYPELLNASRGEGAAVSPLVSNRLSLQVKPRAIIGEDGLAVALDVETGAALARESISPDKVVEWTLRARQKSEWEKFFLYLNLEKMIERDGPRQRRWRAESEEGRRRMLANYRSELSNQVIDGDISAIPFEFEIENTNYNMREGKVSVLEKFRTGGYIERKRYTYYLEKDDVYWSIVDYTVVNLGTE